LTEDARGRQVRSLKGPPLTTSEAARLLGVELQVVQRALRMGYLRGDKVANRWTIDAAALVGITRFDPDRVDARTPRHPVAWMPGFVSAADAARRLGITPGYVGTLVRRGHLEAQRVGVWLAVSEASVATFSRARTHNERAPEMVEVTRLVLSGICPWCGRSELMVPARHITSRHKVDRHQLRRLMGVGARTPICNAQVTAERRQRNARPENLALLMTLAPWKDRKPGQATVRPTDRTIVLPTPEAQSPSRRKRIEADQRARIVARRQAGLTYQAIANSEGLGEATVLRICRGYR
jgi:DNA-binding CsgD family transcriptional regulator